MERSDGHTATDTSQAGHSEQPNLPENTQVIPTAPPPSLEQLAKAMVDLQAQMQLAMAQLYPHKN